MVQGLGFRGFWGWGGSGFRVQGLGLGVQGSGFLGFWGSGFRVSGSGFRVQGLGFWGFWGFGVPGLEGVVLPRQLSESSEPGYQHFSDVHRGADDDANDHHADASSAAPTLPAHSSFSAPAAADEAPAAPVAPASSTGAAGPPGFFGPQRGGPKGAEWAP